MVGPSRTSPATTRHGRRTGSPVRRFLALSVALGVVTAGIALPLVGSGAIAARNAALSFEDLPSILDAPPSPARTTILANDGSLLAEFALENRVQVPLRSISQPMRDAIVAIEDSRFYEHGGVDLRGSLRALARNSSAGSVEEGGSTLTQQYVKNVLVENAATDEERRAASERTLARKLQEARYAVALEKRLSKHEILERYLNIAYFGDGAYGVEAAAQHYFGISAADLDLTRAATLAGIVQQPIAYDPTRNPEATERRRDVVLNRMLTEGVAEPQEVTESMQEPIADYLDVVETEMGCVTSYAPYFCDYVLTVIRNEPAFGPTAESRMDLLRRGGLTISTTLDPDAQKAAQKVVDDAIPRRDKSRKATSVVSIEPGTGEVRVMAQNRTYGTRTKRGETTINYAVGSANNGWRDGVQGGSTFKAFTLAAALEDGIPVNTSYRTSRVQSYYGYENCDGENIGGFDGLRSGSSGTHSMEAASALSVNGYFASLEREVGVCKTARMIERLGVRQASGARVAQVPSLTLGSAATTPMDVAEAYATFAAHGVHCNPVAITSVVDREGEELALPDPACEQVMKPAVADTVAELLTATIDGPLGSRTGRGLSLGRPAAGKTGTTDDNQAVWFAGFTPQVSTAVWVGDPRGGAKHPMQNVRINGQFYAQVYGATLPGPIWKSVMEAIHEGEPKQKFRKPDPGGGVNGIPTRVPELDGFDQLDAMEQLEEIGLEGKLEEAVPSLLPAGTVLSTSPSTGSRVRSGDTIRVVISNGQPPPPPPPPPPTTEAPEPPQVVEQTDPPFRFDQPGSTPSAGEQPRGRGEDRRERGGQGGGAERRGSGDRGQRGG